MVVVVVVVVVVVIVIVIVVVVVVVVVVISQLSIYMYSPLERRWAHDLTSRDEEREVVRLETRSRKPKNNAIWQDRVLSLLIKSASSSAS